MRIVLTPEQRALQDVLRRLFADTCTDGAGRIDRGADVASRVHAALARAGLLALAYPTQLGGDGAGLYATGLMFQEGGRVLCPSTVFTTVFAGLSVSLVAEPAEARTWIESIAAGTRTATTAFWSSDDARTVRPAISARRTDGGELTLDGTAWFVENAADVDAILVSAAVAGTSEAAVVAVARDEPGVRIDPLDAFGRDKMAHVTLTDYRAEPRVVLGPVTEATLARLAERTIALQCMEMVGGTQRVLEDTVAYVKAREQFGRPIGSFQAVQHMVADLRIALDGARLCAWRAVCAVDGGSPSARSVAIAKLHCSEAYKQTTLQAHQLMGGMGYLRESDLHLWSERAKLSEIRNGSPSIVLGWLADDLDALRVTL